jgi:FAD binding domain/Berberine and berberine like
MSTTDRLGSEAIERLRTSLRGSLLQPGEPGYDAARTIDNAMIDRRPALIARCAGLADVVTAVRFGRTHGVPVSVRGGGHNVAGNAVCDGGLMIDLSPMKGVRVDPIARTVRAEPGLTWGEFDSETQAFGLATTGGVISTTGIAGLTLGGGVGWLNGRFGLACDSLISADVVTAEAEFLRASERENEDLFWGLRGGGGNFGIVTSFEYRLHPLGPVLAGPVFHPAARAREVLRFYREFTAGEPDELTTYAGLLTGPDGTPLVGIVVCYSGPLEQGEKLVEPVRKFGPPVADHIGPMPYRAAQQMFDAAFPHGRYNYWKSSLAPQLDDALIEVVVEQMARVPSPYSAVMLEHYHGAYSRPRPSDTAYRHRAATYDVVIIANWPERADTERNVAWTRDLFRAVQACLPGGGVYVNFLDGDEGTERIRAAYGDNYDRLVALKRKYDPTNFFRMNQNIRPD